MLDIQINMGADSIEVFAMDGTIELTERYFFSAEFNKIELFAETGRVYVENLSITQIK
jgi:sucrose-6-phosphate hydrolase SacC (GH32 family)